MVSAKGLRFYKLKLKLISEQNKQNLYTPFFTN